MFRRVRDRSCREGGRRKAAESTARLVGEMVTVVEPIDNGRGRVKVGDSVWLCRGPDAPAGARVRVVGAEASVLQVELA